MKLIEFDNFEIKVADEAFLIRPIRELFEKDKSKKKEEFFRQLSYLYFMCDPRSTYQYITDETSRSLEIKAQEGFDVDWEPSELLKQAMDVYRSHTITTTSLLLKSMRKGIDNLRMFLENVDLTDVDKNGKPVYPISGFTSALKQIPEMSRAFFEAEKSLAKEFEDQDSAARGSREKSLYEDGI